MKFLCPNCKAKYRIGSEKLVGRQVAKIRCRKCDYRIQIVRQAGSEEYQVTAAATSMVPPAPKKTGSRAAKPTEGGRKKPTAAVPGLPGLGSPTSTRGALRHAKAGRGPGEGRELGAEAQGGSAAVAGPPSALGAARAAPVPAAVAPAAVAPAAVAPAAPSAFSPAAPASVPQFVEPAPPPEPVAAAAAPAPAPPPEPVAAAPAPPPEPVAPPANPPGDEGPEDGWFVGVNGVPLGPVPVDDLRELAAAGHIDRRSLVWREGFAEWLPLGQFGHLVRAIDQSAGAVDSQANSAAGVGDVARQSQPGPPPAGQGAVAPPAAERPGWREADDEDDDDQPTTVKGRVSAPPPGAGGQGIPIIQGLDPVPRVPAPVVGEGHHGGAIAMDLSGTETSVQGAPGAPPFAGGLAPEPHVPGSEAFGAPATEMGAQSSSISATPAPVVDAPESLRRSDYTKIYVALAIAAAIAFGAALMSVMQPEQSDGGAGASAEIEPKGRAPARSGLPTSTEGASSQEGEPSAGDEPSPADESQEAASDDDSESKTPTAKTSLRSRGKPSRSATTQPAGSEAPRGTLLSGLNAPTTPGPSVGSGSGSERSGGGQGLDEAAIVRTVGRYKRAVRRKCWTSALSSRAPGAPTSAKVTATITVNSNGQVRSVTTEGAQRGYPGLARCIESSVRGWRFPRSSTSTVTSVPFMFVGQ